jgi:hypothetical protein
MNVPILTRYRTPMEEGIHRGEFVCGNWVTPQNKKQWLPHLIDTVATQALKA